MTKEQLQFIVETAKGYLYEDRCNPDIGMGLSASTAVDMAIEHYINTGRIFLPNTKIIVSVQEKENINSIVQQWAIKNNM